MKRLFIIDSDYNVELNKEWLYLVPEFKKIMQRKWSCEGDYDGRKKIMQQRVFGYIYLMLEYASPLFNYEEDARRAEALSMMNLKPGDIDEAGVAAAYKKYEELMEGQSRILLSLRGVYAVMDKMDNHLKTIDFNAVDKMGKPLHTPASVIRVVKDMNMAYDSIQQMERRVMEDMKKEGNTIRGKATLGGKEGKRAATIWTEGIGPEDNEISKSIENAIEDGKPVATVATRPTMSQLGNYLKPLIEEEDE